MWFVLAIIGYILLAFVFILDKYILSTAKQKSIVYAVYSSVPLLAAFFLFPWTRNLLVGIDWWWAVLSGVTFALGFWAMFVAFEKGEVSHMSPFVGVFITIVVAILSFLFFHEQLSSIQLSGIGLLIFASFLLSAERSKAHRGIHVGFLWAAIAGVLFAVSHVSAKYLYTAYPFLTALMWSKGAGGFVGLALLGVPRVRRALREKETPFRQHHGIGLVVIDKIAALAAVLLIQYSIARGNVTIVNALGGFQYVFMFLGIVALTRWKPKIFKEYFTRRELQTQTIAIILVVIGAWLCIS